MPDLVFDPEGIHRAVLNVVTNAIDAASERPTAGPRRGRTAVLRRARRWCGSRSRTTGRASPPSRWTSSSAPSSRSKKSRGTGLGLPVSQKILNEHGGRILVDSELGQGSRFTLELPAVLPEAVRQTGPSPAAPPGA